MDWEIIKHIVEVLATIFTLITLYFVWRQMGEMNQQTRQLAQQTCHNSTATIATLYKEIAVQMIEIDKIFIDHPMLRPFMYDNKPLSEAENGQQSNQVLALAETFIDFFDLIATSLKISEEYQTHEIFQKHLKEWLTFIKSMYQTSPAIRKTIQDKPDWWSPELYRLFEGLPIPV